MADEREIWIRHSHNLAIFTGIFHALQFVASVLLWTNTRSAAVLAFGLDALVSAGAAALVGCRIATLTRRRFLMLRPVGLALRGAALSRWDRAVGYAYIASSVVAFYLGASMLWAGERPARNLLGIGLAAVSMLIIPIIGSYMKTLGVELRSQTLRSAAVFTFGNSYLSMVLLIAQLLNTGMDLGWGDPLGALVMFPFMAQKGIQILIEEGHHEYVED
jgi:divalent metal cation (Fe/Co/Zn/Cd) transporter